MQDLQNVLPHDDATKTALKSIHRFRQLQVDDDDGDMN